MSRDKILRLADFKRANAGFGDSAGDVGSPEQVVLPAPSTSEPGAAPAHRVGPQLRGAKKVRGDWRQYDDEVRRVLEQIEAQELLAIETAEQPSQHRIRLSVALVLRAAGRGRTQAYKSHPEIVSLIAEARSRLESALAARTSKSTRSRRGRLERIGEVKRKHEAELARVASVQLSELLAAMGPFDNAGSLLGAENDSLRKEVKNLQVTISHQAEAMAYLGSEIVRLGTEARTGQTNTSAPRVSKAVARRRSRKSD
jgi:hypothetical protein